MTLFNELRIVHVEFKLLRRWELRHPSKVSNLYLLQHAVVTSCSSAAWSAAPAMCFRWHWKDCRHCFAVVVSVKWRQCSRDYRAFRIVKMLKISRKYKRDRESCHFGISGSQRTHGLHIRSLQEVERVFKPSLNLCASRLQTCIWVCVHSGASERLWKWGGHGRGVRGSSPGKKFQKLKPIASRFPGIWCHFSVR